MKTMIGLSLLVMTSVSAANNSVNTEIHEDGFKTAYEVPVDDPALAPYARFEMTATVKFQNNRWEFCYRLPWEVTSKSSAIPTIEFVTTKQLTPETYEVKGKHTTGTCTFGKKSSCHLFYSRMNLDAEVTKSDLAKIFSGEELTMRTKVAETFAFDPEGILLFEIP